MITDSPTEQTWVYTTMHPPPPSLSVSLFPLPVLPKDSRRNLNQRWQVHSRTASENKMQNKGRKQGGEERRQERGWQHTVFSRSSCLRDHSERKIFKKKKQQPVMFYWNEKNLFFTSGRSEYRRHAKPNTHVTLKNMPSKESWSRCVCVRVCV